MTMVKEIFNVLEAAAPCRLAEDYDNALDAAGK